MADTKLSTSKYIFQLLSSRLVQSNTVSAKNISTEKEMTRQDIKITNHISGSQVVQLIPTNKFKLPHILRLRATEHGAITKRLRIKQKTC